MSLKVLNDQNKLNARLLACTTWIEYFLTKNGFNNFDPDRNIIKQISEGDLLLFIVSKLTNTQYFEKKSMKNKFVALSKFSKIKALLKGIVDLENVDFEKVCDGDKLAVILLLEPIILHYQIKSKIYDHMPECTEKEEDVILAWLILNCRDSCIHCQELTRGVFKDPNIMTKGRHFVAVASKFVHLNVEVLLSGNTIKLLQEELVPKGIPSFLTVDSDYFSILLQDGH